MFAKATRRSDDRPNIGADKVAIISVGSSTILPVTYCIAIAITAPTTTKNEPAAP